MTMKCPTEFVDVEISLPPVEHDLEDCPLCGAKASVWTAEPVGRKWCNACMGLVAGDLETVWPTT